MTKAGIMCLVLVAPTLAAVGTAALLVRSKPRFVMALRFLYAFYLSVFLLMAFISVLIYSNDMKMRLGFTATIVMVIVYWVMIFRHWRRQGEFSNRIWR